MLSRLDKQVEAQFESRRRKRVELLQLAADIVRALRGGRATSCKSAKDRTSMSVTLEQVSSMQRSCLPPTLRAGASPAPLRCGAGTRAAGAVRPRVGGHAGACGRHAHVGGAARERAVRGAAPWAPPPSSSSSPRCRQRGSHPACGAAGRSNNVGKPRFAFNRVQLQLFPREYRPPLQTIGGVVT